MAIRSPFPKKRVMILNADSFVGQHVVRQFYNAREYSIDVTLSKQDNDLIKRISEGRMRSGTEIIPVSSIESPSAADSLFSRETSQRLSGSSRPTSRKQQQRVQEKTLEDIIKEIQEDEAIDASDRLPENLFRFVDHIVPRHNDASEVFGKRLIENDIIVAILEDDMYEAECAIKILMGTHYEVEKTFVLVSSMLTWANTLTAERFVVRAQRKAQRNADLMAFLEDNEDNEDEEVPEELQEPKEEETEENLVENRVFDESEYGRRVPLPRYQHWRVLEHLTKHANSETLHTYALFSGLPYGQGEGLLSDLFHAAWHHQTLPMYGHGRNVIPLIHVDDLSRIIYRVGASEDTLEERYLFAVDRSMMTQKKLLECIQKRIGGEVLPLSPPRLPEMVDLQDAKLNPPSTMDELQKLYFNHCGLAALPYMLSDIRAEPGSVLNILPEEEWEALEGFAEHMEKVVYQYMHTRGIKPQRVVVTGPPFSGKEVISKVLSFLYHTPYLTKESVVEEFQAHTNSLRERLRELLVTRLQRRRDRRHARRSRAARIEKERIRQAKLARKAESDEEEEDEEDESDGEVENQKPSKAKGRAARGDSESDDENEEEEEEETEEEESFHEENEPEILFSDNLPAENESFSDISMVFSEDLYEKTAEEIVDERYILGPGYGEEHGGDEDDEIDEEVEEDEDPYEFEEEEADEIVPLPSQMRARETAKAQEEAELVEIVALRQEYQLCLRALAQKTVNGLLPRPPPDVEEEEEEEELPRRQRADRGERARRRAADDDEEGEEEMEEEEDEESDEGGEENEEGEEGDHKGEQAGAEAPPDVIRYLDEGLAFFTRWRLRQADCRNQGFVLDGFPETVRQACLLFLADSEEEKELQARRLLTPAATEDVPPPIDHAFPFCEIDNIEEEQRKKLEEDLANDRIGILEALEEGILSAVNERFFPDTVVVLQESDAALQTMASLVSHAFETAQHETLAECVLRGSRQGSRERLSEAHVAQASVSGHLGKVASSGLSPVFSATGSRSEGCPKTPVDGVQGSFLGSRNSLSSPGGVGRVGTASPSGLDGRQGLGASGANESQLRLGQPGAREDYHSRRPSGYPEHGSINQSMPTLPLMEYTARLLGKEDALPDGTLVDQNIASLAFFKALTYYRKHHGLSAPASVSLITWFQSVATTEVVGATPELVMVEGRPIGSGDEEGTDMDEAGAMAEAPSTNRLADVQFWKVPPRDVPTMREEALAIIDKLLNRTGTKLGTHERGPSTASSAQTNTSASSGVGSSFRLTQGTQGESGVGRFAPPLFQLHGLNVEEARLMKELPTALESFALTAQASHFGTHAVPSSPTMIAEERAEAAHVREESARLARLREEEEVMKARAEAEELEAVLQEHRELVQHHVLDSSIGGNEGARLPAETYLMTYVLPSLTPLMSEVVKMRPDDPVTVLADMLFKHQRRTQL